VTGAILAVGGALAAGVAIGGTVAARRWRSATAALVSRLRLEADGASVASVSADPLPRPVARYLRAVLPPDGAALRYARLEQRGEFLARPPDAWRPFTAVEHFAARPPGFVWDARIRMAPGVAVRVRDGFVSGRGSMSASVMGVLRVAALEGSAELSAGALQRYLAEGVWIPSALRPEEGVRWAALSATSARASITVQGVTAAIDFHFAADGLVARIYTEARARDAGGGRMTPTPWQGRFSRYEMRDGYRIPLHGEVEWLMPDGPMPYWRGEITAVRFERRPPSRRALSGEVRGEG